MTDVTIPLDANNCPDLQALVRQLGEAAAQARGEIYDPRNKPEHGGYQYITREIWAAFDTAMVAYRAERHDILAPAPALPVKRVARR